MKNLGEESPWGGVSNSRVKANLGPAWESWLGHSSTRFQMHKAMKMKAVLCTHGKSGRQLFQGDCVGCGPWEPSDSCKGKHASGCWKQGEMQGPSTENPQLDMNTPHPAELLHFSSVALTLPVVTKHTVTISSVQICTKLPRFKRLLPFMTEFPELLSS